MNVSSILLIPKSFFKHFMSEDKLFMKFIHQTSLVIIIPEFKIEHKNANQFQKFTAYIVMKANIND